MSDPPNILRFVIVVAGIALTCVLARRLRGRAIAWPRGRGRRAAVLVVDALGFVVVIVGLIVICAGHFSPSEVPALWRLRIYLAAFMAAGIALQLGTGWWVLRRQTRGHADAPRRRLALANGLAIAGLLLTLAPVALVTAWFAPPYLEVPEPHWLVAIPAGKLAAGCAAAATAFALLVELVRFALAKRAG